jgi:lysophospholipase L1-like esterase
MEIEVRVASVGDYTVDKLEQRLDEGVLRNRASLVVVLLGLNDLLAESTTKAYEEGLRKVVRKIQESGASALVATPMVRGEKTDNTNPSDSQLNEFAGACHRVCDATGATLCDLRATFIDYLKEKNKTNVDKGILTIDGIALNAEGHRVVANRLAGALADALQMRAMRQWIGDGRGMATWAGDDAPFQRGDKVIFFGDSITSSGTSGIGYITLLNRAIKRNYPDLDVQLVNSGNSGNKVPNLQARLHSDVLSKKPTLLFIYIGINDVWHDTAWDGSGTPPYAFKAGLRHIIEKARDRGATIVLATPSVIGEKFDGTNELDKRLDEYATISRELAKEMNVTPCDLRTAFLDYLKKHNLENHESGVLTVDRVHLNALGNLLVAHKAAEAIGQALSSRNQPAK